MRFADPQDESNKARKADQRKTFSSAGDLHKKNAAQWKKSAMDRINQEATKKVVIVSM